MSHSSVVFQSPVIIKEPVKAVELPSCRRQAAHQFRASCHISVKPAALKSAAAITRCPPFTVGTLTCGGGFAATLHAPSRPDLAHPCFPPLLLRARAAACIMPNLFVKVQQFISCRRDPLRLRQAVRDSKENYITNFNKKSVQP